ncbi:hypothetical protein Goklo_029651 [Gossypium klotzschianum]|uniref:Uncharacterized protein n=1 Tax=Gossypium klotzschianum TaxID=34286 RepID=A0A7J8W5M0_9ROSI|nr:hypothetical protein [Gossypium klotzschianum]
MRNKMETFVKLASHPEKAQIHMIHMC